VIGTQGFEGMSGSVNGTQGMQGNVGNQGTLGVVIVGFQGARGLPGVNLPSVGSQGAQGIVGTQGIVGAQASAGASGRIGLYGPQGRTSDFFRDDVTSNGNTGGFAVGPATSGTLYSLSVPNDGNYILWFDGHLSVTGSIPGHNTFRVVVRTTRNSVVTVRATFLDTNSDPNAPTINVKGFVSFTNMVAADFIDMLLFSDVAGTTFANVTDTITTNVFQVVAPVAI
jgi:hypothetical protein